MRVKVDTQTPEIRYQKLFERGLNNDKTLIDQKTTAEKAAAFSTYKKRDDFVNAIIGENTEDAIFLENNFDFQSLQQKIDYLYQLAVSRNNNKTNQILEDAPQIEEQPKLNKTNIGKIAREEDVVKEISYTDEIYKKAEQSLELNQETMR